MPKFVQPDYNTQTGTAYPLNIDADAKVLSRLGAAYNPCAEDTPAALKVVVQAGALFVNGALVANADQTITLATAHATLPRIDRVVIDVVTGVASKIDGTAAASPVAPAITSGKLPVAQVLVTATMTVVANSAITDERAEGAVVFGQGSWTPSVGGTATYTLQAGRYFKIGKIVHFFGELTINVLGTGSGTTVSGLPFTTVNVNPGNVYMGYFSGLTVNVASLMGKLTAGSSIFQLFHVVAAGAASVASTAVLGNASSIIFSGSYEATN